MNLGKRNIKIIITDASYKTETISSKIFSYRLIQNGNETLEEPANCNKSITFTKNDGALPRFLKRRKYIKKIEDSSEVYY